MFVSLDCIDQLTGNYLKSITFIRHAKSSWDYPELNDFDRPLNDRGLRDAPFMGKKLLQYGARFDLIISSPSKRTSLTIQNICSQIKYHYKDIRWEGSIFHSSLSDLKKVIAELDNTLNSVAIVGHNPSITSIVNQMQYEELIENVPTAGVVCISFEYDNWQFISSRKGKLEYFIYPKKFK